MQGNSFQGSMPSTLRFSKGIQVLDLSHINLPGKIPKYLVDFQLKILNLSSNDFDGVVPIKGIFKNAIATLLMGNRVILALSLLLQEVKKSRREIFFSQLENSLLKVSYQSLLKATKGFSLDNLMGVGNFSSVYKGVPDQDETFVAVKVLNLSRQGAFKSLLVECKALRNIRNRNLVKVITACSGVDYQGNDFKTLVYEFMANGNLEEWLWPI
ncbi:unnamed protein product [Ilex paraguariensis]|uniref:Protein kinase domain-containing protein n=1 Tax=Ilex paraguariensis TaxID=185542 RepID=A0ABC8R3J6_9AQUA